MMPDDPFARQRQRAFITSSASAPIFPTSPSPSSSFSFSGDRRTSTASPSPVSIPLRHSRSPSPSTSAASRHSLTPSTFLHNSRLAFALVPAALFLLDLGGTPVFTILTLGLAAAYFFDSAKFSVPSFLSIWVSLVLSQVAFFFSSSPSLSHTSLPLTGLSLFLCAETTFLIGVWASVNFRWIQIEHPAIAISLERLLFACVPVTVPSLFTWAVISAVGMPNSSYYFMIFSCVFYWVFSIPRTSSFKKGNADPSILGQLECCFHSLYILFVPLLFHIGSHHSTIFSSWSSVCELLLLFFIPFLFQLYASTRGALWWVTTNSHQIHRIRVVNGAVAVIVVVLCLEVRVIFHSFGKYLHAAPPLNYILVTVVMLGGAVGLGAHMVGMVNDAVSSLAFTALTVLVSAAGAIVVGFPIPFILLPMIAGFCLAQFFTRKSLSSYFTFVALATLMVLWFVVHNYWDLNIWLAAMPLKTLTKYLVLGIMLAMTVPGLTLLPVKFRFLIELGLIGHALLLCYVEDKLFNHAAMYYYGYDEEVVYPSYAVLVTTFLGMAIVRRMSVDMRVGPKAGWILTCLYCSKISMLFIASRSVVWVSAVLLLAVTPPLLLYKDRTKGVSKMKVWQGYAHAGVVAISAWFCLDTIFEAIQWLQGRPPSDSLLLGSYILLTGIACIPIVALHFSHSQLAKRFLLLVIATGCLLVTMQPPLSLSWVFRSKLIQMAHQSNDDVSIYGYTLRGPTWPSWLLISTVILTLASITSIIPVKYIAELRALYSIIVGVTLGIYISVQYFFGALMLYPLLITTVTCAAVFVVFTHIPSASSTRILPWVFAMLVALFPVTYLLEGQVRAKGFAASAEEEQEADRFSTMLAIQGARLSLLGLYAAIFMLIALVIKFDLAALLHEKAGSNTQKSRVQPHSLPKTRLFQQRRQSATPSLTIKRLSAEAAWMPLIGNISTILCFLICLILNITLTGSSNRAIFFLAPILLLLNQDSDIISGFGDRQRYFPVTIVVSSYLVLVALYRIWEEVFWTGDNESWGGLSIGGPGWLFVVKNLALLILTLPNHILFNRFMWDYVKQTDAMLLLTMPLNLPSIVITDVLTIRVLGLLGIIYSLAQYLISRRIRIAGMRYI
ncbi:No exine formation 1 [Rhynchospora pubera]|uniref:No exine formation 1 n=1 Tax=Rhynchospora pubera TaxID=906938 RepID=A0AAV8FVW8_9POAL|nr:No exine formation 1 [Rhynchospora pubera]